METIVVTGASGGIGGRVLRMLLHSPKYNVVAMVRDPQSPNLPDNTNLEVRQADYDVPIQLNDAFADASTLLFISSDGEIEQMKRHHRNVVNAAKHCQIRRIIYTSIIDIAEDSGFYTSPVHQYTERILLEADIPSVMARTSVFQIFLCIGFISQFRQDKSGYLPVTDGHLSLLAMMLLLYSRPRGLDSLSERGCYRCA